MRIRVIKMKQIIYTRCAPRKDLFNKNLSVYDAGFGVFSLSEDVYDLDADTLKSLQTLLERRNGSDFLTNNFCSFEYTEINGISGIKFTSKVDEKQFIFLPSNGIAVDSNIVNVGKCGNYWSKNIMDMNSDLACALNFIGVDVFANGNSSRSYGFGIRPVFKG